MTQEEWDKLPPKIRSSLQQSGIAPQELTPGALGKKPYTHVGAPKTREYTMANMGRNTGGVTVREENNADGKAMPSSESVVAYNSSPKSVFKDQPDTVRAHEMEHVLANKGLGTASRLNTKWNELSGGNRGDIVARLVQHAPYLQKEWGLADSDIERGYFSKAAVDEQASSGTANNLLYEQMATLSALEQAQNRRLTDDPYLRENVFKTKADRETYNALTGLRQTRLDARDLPPYTRQPEPERTEPGMMDKIKSMLRLNGQ